MGSAYEHLSREELLAVPSHQGPSPDRRSRRAKLARPPSVRRIATARWSKILRIIQNLPFRHRRNENDFVCEVIPQEALGAARFLRIIRNLPFRHRRNENDFVCEVIRLEPVAIQNRNGVFWLRSERVVVSQRNGRDGAVWPAAMPRPTQVGRRRKSGYRNGPRFRFGGGRRRDAADQHRGAGEGPRRFLHLKAATADATIATLSASMVMLSLGTFAIRGPPPASRIFFSKLCV